MIASLSLTPLLRPRDHLRRAAATNRARAGAGAVALTAGGSMILDLLTAWTDPVPARPAAVASAVVVPALIVSYWFLSGALIDAGIRAMGRPSQRGGLLAASAVTLPVLLTYPLITLAQALAWHAGAASVSDVLGWLALPALAWFVVLQIVVVITVYDVEFLSALSLVLLPSAAVTALLLALIVIISAVQAVSGAA